MTFRLGLASLMAIAALTAGIALAQSPSPTTTVSPVAATATPSPTTPSANPTPAATVTPAPKDLPPVDGGEPPFNYDIVKEVVVTLIGDDGRTHYVTMSQDTAGIVRFRFSLFNFPTGFYQVYVMSLGKCGPDAMTRRVGGLSLRGDVPIAQLHAIQQSAEGEQSLVLYFENTDQLSLTPGRPNSIYDADGTALILRGGPVVADPAPIAACAVLATPPGTPETGTGLHPTKRSRPLWPVEDWVAVLLLATSAITVPTAGRRTRTRP